MNLRKDHWHKLKLNCFNKTFPPRIDQLEYLIVFRNQPAQTFLFSPKPPTFAWSVNFGLRNNIKTKPKDLPINDGSLGSRNDEERRETRYVMWIAGLSESSNLWTQIAARTLAARAYLLQTRFANTKCFIDDAGRCELSSFGSPQELSRAWLRINAAGTKVTFTKVRGRAATKPLNTYRLELKSGKRTRWI